MAPVCQERAPRPAVPDAPARRCDAEPDRLERVVGPRRGVGNPAAGRDEGVRDTS